MREFECLFGPMELSWGEHLLWFALFLIMQSVILGQPVAQGHEKITLKVSMDMKTKLTVTALRTHQQNHEHFKSEQNDMLD